MSVEREALERLDALSLPWYVTGSWALAAYAEPRMTRDAWARSAMERRDRIEHPTLGPIWISSAEDLILAKLEWSEGTSELQLRDVRSIVRLTDGLDWRYLEGYADGLGIGDRLESVRGG